MVRAMEDILANISPETDSISVSYLQLGEAHRIAAITKLNIESSQSHALLMVHVNKSVVDRDEVSPEAQNHSISNLRPPMLCKGKLIVVDLAGSEHIHKSGSERHMLEEAKSINV